ncbi:MAG TPA: DMT family transporter [Candidatus Wallbacteria bacterium]|nr:DMT family transporter [Candidatus Wallbacteria bacterium]
MKQHSNVIYAIAASLLFGLSTPFSKILLGEVNSFMLAGLLYFGSGAGLLIYMAVRSAIAAKNIEKEANLSAPDYKWLAGVTFFGGFLGPVLLLYGLNNSTASAASLLLNMEGVFTALMAWFVFNENFDRRIAAGMAAITLGGVALSWGGTPDMAGLLGPVSIMLACFCWAIDNNLTKKISAADPFQIASIKGLIAGGTNLLISFFVLKIGFPGMTAIISSCAIGFLGYGLSIALFVLSLRHIGTSRTGAYFSLAPFFGAAASIAIFGEPVTLSFFIALILMGIGVWCHLSESHDHEHFHEFIEHEHAHSHDDLHHDHVHEAECAADGKHSHRHTHKEKEHSHFHYPDLHHHHGHV